MGVRKETFTIARPKIQHIVDNNFNLCMSGSDKLQTVCVGVYQMTIHPMTTETFHLQMSH